MSEASRWQAIPADVLQRVFELQPEGLANCGAASSCVAWRNIAENSCVNYLHLHAESDRQERRWPQLLAARRCIDTLKLVRTADKPICSGFEYAAFRSDVVAEATIRSIPTACRSLCLSEFAAYGLEQYISKSPEVQQLSIQWNGVRAGCHFFNSLPSFAALGQLKELTIQIYNDFDGNSFRNLVRGCPETVESLMLEGFGASMRSQLCAVRSLALLEGHLPALTRLQLAGSLIRIPGEDITCLSKLRSLSLCDSTLYVDRRLELTLLTKLTSLDLTGTSCFSEIGQVKALDTFTAWPALAVLKALCSKLFDKDTVVDVSDVREVHIEHFEVYAQPGPEQQAHVRIPASYASRYDSGRTASIQHLDLGVGGPVQLIDPLLTYVAANYSLQSLILETFCLRDKRVFEGDKFTGGSFSKLTHLAITGAHPVTHTLRLQALTCLTSLVLQKIDCWWTVTLIELPLTVEAFTFTGSSLFISGTKHNLHKLPLLTKVVFEIASRPGFVLRLGPCVPQLPSNLRHLVLAGSEWCRFDCDFLGLFACSSLQHLTLAADQQMSGTLREWVSSARCLYVVDHVEPVAHITMGSSSYCRLPLLYDVPDWHLASTSQGHLHLA